MLCICIGCDWKPSKHPDAPPRCGPRKRLKGGASLGDAAIDSLDVARACQTRWKDPLHPVDRCLARSLRAIDGRAARSFAALAAPYRDASHTHLCRCQVSQRQACGSIRRSRRRGFSVLASASIRFRLFSCSDGQARLGNRRIPCCGVAPCVFRRIPPLHRETSGDALEWQCAALHPMSADGVISRRHLCGRREEDISRRGDENLPSPERWSPCSPQREVRGNELPTKEHLPRFSGCSRRTSSFDFVWLSGTRRAIGFGNPLTGKLPPSETSVVLLGKVAPNQKEPEQTKSRRRPHFRRARLLRSA